MEKKVSAFFGVIGQRDPDGDLLCDVYAGVLGNQMLKEMKNIEEQIDELQVDEYVTLARQYKAYKQQRIDRLQELKQLKREGIRLHDAGWKAPEEDEDDAET